MGNSRYIDHLTNEVEGSVSDFEDHGCEHYSKCVQCPLVDCVLEFPGRSGKGDGPLSRAIQASWKAGINDPSFATKYRGQWAEAPDHILREQGIPTLAMSYRHNWKASDLQRIKQVYSMREAGADIKTISAAVGVSEWYVGAYFWSPAKYTQEQAS